jgi:hypothetical protein
MMFMVLTTIISILAVIFIPKRVNLSELYSTSLFAVTLASIVDIYLDIKLDLYGFFQKGPDWAYIPIFIVVYPAANILFLNLFPYNKALTKKIIYILGWSFGALLLELISLKTDLFYYRGWKWWYSASLYPFVFTLLYFNLKMIRKLAVL